METGIDTFAEVIRRQFGLEKQDIRTCSPLTLAYIGDSIYDLVIRTKVVEEGNCPPNSLHKKASSMVKAHAQAEMIEKLLPDYRRGRNAKSYTMAKNATMHDYRKATGMEAVMGFLYLEGRMERLLELVGKGLILIGKEKETTCDMKN